MLDNVHGVAHSVVAGVNGSVDRSWFMDHGQKSLDPAWLKEAAARLTQNDLREFANNWLNDFTKFAMVSTKVK